MEEIIKHNTVEWKKRLLIGTATMGWIRFEWAHARYGQVMPVNWEASGLDISYAPMGYSIDDAYNMMVAKAIEIGVEWVLMIEDDVILPPDCFLRMSQYMDDGKIPIVSGIYCNKGVPSEPLVFRGRGNGTYKNWKFGQKIWCDGLTMGCLLIHTSILKWFWEHTEKYRVPSGEEVSRVFETPRKVEFDITKSAFRTQQGTQDLHFFDQIMEHEVMKKTGWKDIARKKYQFLADTNIFCKHICRNTGKVYPLVGVT